MYNFFNLPFAVLPLFFAILPLSLFFDFHFLPLPLFKKKSGDDLDMYVFPLIERRSIYFSTTRLFYVSLQI
jgi:hypothetical protein